MLLVFLFLIPLVLQAVPVGDKDAYVVGSVLVVCYLAAANLLNRRFPELMAVANVIVISFIILGFMWLLPYRIQTFILIMYLLIPVLMSSVFLPLRFTVVVILLNLGGLIFTITNNPALQGAEIILGSVAFYVIFSSLIVLVTDHRNCLEGDRRAELAEQEERLRLYFEEANDWIFTLDANGIISAVNRAMCQDTGYTAAELVGQSPLMFLDVEMRQKAREPLQQILTGLTVQRLELPVPTKDGRILWVDIKGVIFQENGRVTGTFHIARDITEFKRIQAALQEQSEQLEELVAQRTAELQHTTQRLQTILNSSPDIILFLSPDGRVRICNPASTDFFGDESGIREKKLAELAASPVQSQIIHTVIQSIVADKQPQRLVTVARRQDGVLRDLDMMLAVVQEGEEVTGIVASIRDISALKEVERMKDQFVASVSHELRTPLTNMKLYHDLLQRNPQKQVIYLEYLGRSIDDMHMLIENLLCLSYLDQQLTDLSLDSLPLAATVAEWVQATQSLTESKGVHLGWHPCGCNVKVAANASLLRQAFFVLLHNAIAYIPSGGSVVVSAELAQVSDQPGVSLHVSDTGPGITPEDLPHIFDRFYRGQAALDFGVPGTGLGLAIAQEIIQRHNGRITVKTVLGEGSTFTIWLPVLGDLPNRPTF
ncbi:MAG: PAS domain S-box protein [Chloroflexi bacterium]|nr:PAS domain S-box protein [Chloroflexota bacterium]